MELFLSPRTVEWNLGTVLGGSAKRRTLPRPDGGLLARPGRARRGSAGHRDDRPGHDGNRASPPGSGRVTR
ncbi:hypothetical protein ACGFI9_36150 [Micromonospora sp. NPDC048930]|uniref:hypothetical protein n=1 Tax=Micromonospora sp. NPDC048930 TaxID=3364261 RepID=UPI0037121ACD